MPLPNEKPLEGWKAIAASLGRSVKTVQRWEEKGLPVCRHEVLGVIAYKSELDVWLQARQTAESINYLQTDSTSAPPDAGKRRQRQYWRWTAVLGVVGLTILLTILWLARLNPKPHSLAVLEFRDLSKAAGTAWLSTALERLFSAELSADRTLLPVPDESVARMQLELALPDVESFSKTTLQRIRRNIGADWVVTGSYLASGSTSDGQLRVQVTVQDARTGKTVATIAANGSEAGLAQLAERSAGALRAQWNAGRISGGQLLASRNALPKNLDAQRFYSAGLNDLHRFNAKSAAESLQRAVHLEPDYALAHAALAAAWEELGYEAKSAAEARIAYENSGSLDPEEALSIEATYREVTKSWDQAIPLYRRLSSFAPVNVEYALRLARAQIRSGKGSDALGTLMQMEKLRLPVVAARIEILRAQAAESMGDFHLEREAAERAAIEANAQEAGLLRAQALLRQCWASYSLGEYRVAFDLAEKARTIFAAMKDRAGEAQALKNMADVIDDQGEHEKGKQLYESALAIFREIGDQTGVAITLNDLAYVYKDLGDLGGARKLFEDSVAVSRQISDQGREALALNGVGIILWRQGDLAVAKRFFEESLSIFQSRGDKGHQATLLNNLGLISEDQGQLNTAQARYEDSLRLLRELGDQSGIARNLGNIGEVLVKKGELASAKKRFEEQQALGQAIREPRQEAYGLQGLGEVALAEGELKVARQYLEKAIGIRSKMGEKGLTAESQLVLAKVALEEGEPSKALRESARITGEFQREREMDFAAQSYVVMAQALLAQGNFPSAIRTLDQARSAAAKTTDFTVRIEILLARARIDAATGSRSLAAKEFTQAAVEAETYGYRGYALEARLAAAETNPENRVTNLGANLMAIEQEAKARGFALIARRASELK